MEQRRERRLEIVATIVLAVTALVTAWRGYQASLWDGIQSSDYSKASSLRTKGRAKADRGQPFRLADLSVFENWLNASIDGDHARADFYRQRFRTEAEPAFEAWIALDPLSNPDAPHSPLAMPEYQLASEQEAAALTAEADKSFQAGEDANSFSDTYTLATLIFAGVLFIAAISERFEYVRVRISLLAFAALGLVAGIAVLLTQPTTSG